jgi:hypothetical protein
MTRFMTWKARLWAAVLATGIASWAGSASAASPYAVLQSDEALKATPAHRYANMTNEQAFAELDRRGISYDRLHRVHGVRAPIRLTGRLHGVDIHSSLPAEERDDSIFEILDARLALALDDFSALLAEHDIVEIVHYTMYRPNVAKPGSGDSAQDRSAEKGLLDGKDGGKSSKHPLKGKDGEAKSPKTKSKKADKSAVTKDKSKGKAKMQATKPKKASAKSKAPATAPALAAKPTDKPADAPKPADKAEVKPTAEKPIDPPASKGVPIEDPKPAADGDKPKPKPTDDKSVATEKPSSNGEKPHADKSKKPVSDKAPPKAKKGDKARSVKPQAKAGTPSSKGAKQDKQDKTKPVKSKGASPASKGKGKTRATTDDDAPSQQQARMKHALVVEEIHDLEPDDGAEKKASWAPPGTRHPAGLAIDVGGLRKKDGTWLTVADHFGGKIGAQTCGNGAKLPASGEGRELWSIVCQANERGLFTYVLTPNYNAAHADHFHMEIKAGSNLVLFQ